MNFKPVKLRDLPMWAKFRLRPDMDARMYCKGGERFACDGFAACLPEDIQQWFGLNKNATVYVEAT